MCGCLLGNFRGLLPCIDPGRSLRDSLHSRPVRLHTLPGRSLRIESPRAPVGGTIMASSAPSTPHRASCRTTDFREAVQRQRARLSLPTPASDILPRAKRKSAFTADSLSCLQEVGAMHAVLRESHAAYVLDEALGGMAEAERDGVDAETQRCLKASTAHAHTHARQARQAERCTHSHTAAR